MNVITKTQWLGTHHLDRIEFTVKFRQEYTLVASLPDHSFEHGNLICEILLLAEKTSHAAIIIFERTDIEASDIVLLPCHWFVRMQWKLKVKVFFVREPTNIFFGKEANTFPRMKVSDSPFFWDFWDFFGVSAKISGWFSLYKHYLENRSWDWDENWPQACLNLSACFPGIFSAIK